MLRPYLIFIVLLIAPLLGAGFMGKDFFAPPFELMIGLYGDYLAQHLYGYDGEGYSNFSHYISCGLATWLIPLFSVMAFYYWINSTRFARWYNWATVWAISTLICFFVSYGVVYSDYDQGYIHESIAQYIDAGDLWGFGFVNVIYALVLFILFSFLLRYWSTNCSTTPIPQ